MISFVLFTTGNKDAQAQPVIKYKAPEVDTNFFYSKSWQDFSLDTDAIMELLPHEGTYYFPKSYTSLKELVGTKWLLMKILKKVNKIVGYHMKGMNGRFLLDKMILDDSMWTYKNGTLIPISLS